MSGFFETKALSYLSEREDRVCGNFESLEIGSCSHVTTRRALTSHDLT